MAEGLDFEFKEGPATELMKEIDHILSENFCHVDTKISAVSGVLNNLIGVKQKSEGYERACMAIGMLITSIGFCSIQECMGTGWKSGK